MKKILTLLALFACASIADAQIVKYAVAPNLAYLQANNFSGVAKVSLLGYNVQGDLGAGELYRFGTSCSTDSGTVFKDASGNCFFRQGYPFTAVNLEWFGAFGDAVVSLTGDANGSTNFTDTAGGTPCTTAAAAGKTHIVIFPPTGTADTQVNTTFTCNSGASFLLASGPSWTKTSGVTYVVGHNDAAAWSAAQTLLTALPNGIGVLNLNSPGYLITSLSNGLGTAGFAINGTLAQVSPLIVGGLGSGKNGLTFNFPSGPPSLKNFGIWCGFAGQDCLEIVNNPGGSVFTNLSVAYAARDCLTFDGQSGTGVESVQINTYNITYCGRHGLVVNGTAGNYLNTSAFHNGNIRGVSFFAAGGACIYGMNTSQSEGVHIDTLECDAQYGSGGYAQSTNLPKTNAIYFNASGWEWNFDQLTIENTGGTAICPTVLCEAVAINYGAGVQLNTTICGMIGGSFWTSFSHLGVCYNAAGSLGLTASGGNATILQSGAFSGCNANVYLTNIGSPGVSYAQYRLLCTGGGTAGYTQIGSTGISNGGQAFTTTTAINSGITSVTVTNTPASVSTLLYLITDANINAFQTN